MSKNHSTFQLCSAAETAISHPDSCREDLRTFFFDESVLIIKVALPGGKGQATCQIGPRRVGGAFAG